MVFIPAVVEELFVELWELRYIFTVVEFHRVARSQGILVPLVSFDVILIFNFELLLLGDLGGLVVFCLLVLLLDLLLSLLSHDFALG